MSVKHFSYHLLLTCIVFISGTVAGQDSLRIPGPWGPRDTLLVQVIRYEGEDMPYRELPMVFVSRLPPEKLATEVAKFNRLRNAVIVTYPYARTAALTLNDVASHLATIKNKSDRKKYIRSREKELKQKFSDPLTNLSVYQGKVLMKLINRQTGNNCYEIIREYRGGLNARMYQTVAFFFGSSLKQDYNTAAEDYDRQIENIVRELDGPWYVSEEQQAERLRKAMR